MMIARLLICVAVSCVTPHASAQLTPPHDWYKNDLTGRLESIIVKFQGNYDLYKQMRRAFVCKGMHLTFLDSTSSAEEVYFLGYHGPKGVRFNANSRLPDDPVGAQWMERWDQRLLFEGRLFRRSGPFFIDRFRALSDDEEIKSAQKDFVNFCPVGMSVSLAGNIFSTGPSENAGWLSKETLESARMNENGDIVQVNLGGKDDRPVQATVVWGKKEGYMPSRVEFALVESQDGKEKLTRLSTVCTSWMTEAGVRVPATMVVIPKWKRNGSEQFELNISHKFEKQLPPPPMITPDTVDWREPLRLVFDGSWQRRESR